MHIECLDHFVLTTAHLEDCLRFYTDVLGMEVAHENNRYTLYFGKHKINIHAKPAEFLPAAKKPKSGALDLCFVVNESIEDVRQELLSKSVKLESDIVERNGALGKMMSIYLRDPDGNLIELCSYG